MSSFFGNAFLGAQQAPVSLTPKCGLCRLYKGCQSPKMPIMGKGRRRILVVGDAPGRHEDEENKPFVGPSGRLLRDTLRDAGYDLERDAWITNALICRPSKNMTPTAAQVSWCHPNLSNALRELKPIVVVTLGRSALISALTGLWYEKLDEIHRWVGWKMPIKNYWLCPAHHPSYVMRMQNDMLTNQFREHLKAAFRKERPPAPQPCWNDRVRLIYDDDEAVSWIRKFHDRGGWVAFDYETTCIKPEWPKARVISCALSDGKDTVSFPWTRRIEMAMGILLMSNRTRKIAANLKMEERWTRKIYGRGVVNWGWDTMLATHCLDSRPGICSLKFQGLVSLGVPPWNRRVEPFLRSKDGPYNRIKEVPLDELLLYGGLDAMFEHGLAMKQRRQMGYED